MTGLKLVQKRCEELELDFKLHTEFLREVLKIGNKDLRSAPFVNSILESMAGKKLDEIKKALEQLRWKASQINDFIHPNYFIKILKNSKSPQKISQSIDDINLNLNWGKPL